ncbi:G-protein coupled receptor daf-37-like [Aplysia californica]|uniref:G-protein coupled receptor daf-37-like n=1 Tax=Aplysia californica TaxID=6500 RepID=A0ABM0K0Z8_APLCA|nr:G-protein coupled receptor daf-37-like [Aplysia californica]
MTGQASDMNCFPGTRDTNNFNATVSLGTDDPEQPCNDGTTYLTRARAEVAVYVLIVVILPIISGFGIAGNVMSICVLLRHGLDKSYNVMLVALACSDSSFLACMFFYSFAVTTGFEYPRRVDSFYFVFLEILRVLDYGGGWVSFSMPLLITSERLLAVFFPLNLSRIVSPLKTSLAVSALFAIFYTMMTYLTVRDGLRYDIEALLVNRSDPEGMVEAAIYRNTLDVTDAVREFSKVVYGPFPICYVFFSCVVLAIKIKLAIMKRNKMTGGNAAGSASSVRVTTTLLVVCLVYTICSTVVFLCHSDVIKDYYARRQDAHMITVVLNEVVNLFCVINCSVNFVIYVVMNKNFRDTYMDMVRFKNCCR